MSTIIDAVGRRGCGCGTPEVCDDPAGMERTRYFGGQIVGPEDLTQDQRHFREKDRRHNRMLHGWGVVCGVEVRPAGNEDGQPIPYTVCVNPGYVLGPYGDEILVDHTVAFDVRRVTDDVTGECPPPVDPWCAEIRVDRDPGRTLYLAIRFEECPTRPVEGHSACGCGCGADCQYSRIVDGYALGMLDNLPEAYRTARSEAEVEGGLSAFGVGALAEALRCTASLRRAGRSCPPCPTSPWVILADLVLRADGTVDVDQWTHRRFVASFGSYGFFCEATRGERPVIDRTTRDVILRLVSNRARPEVAAIERPEALLALPAARLRGSGASTALTNLIGTRTVGDLARTDPDRFVRAATDAGVNEDDARAVMERAQLLGRVVDRGGVVD